MSRTAESLDRLISTASNWESNAFTVKVGATDSSSLSAINTSISAGVTDYLTDLSNQLSYIGTNISDAFTNTDQYLEVADAAGSAVLGYLESKLLRLKETLTATETVSLGSILEEVAPYALDFKNAGKLLKNRLKDLSSYATNTLSNAIGLDVTSNTLDRDALNDFMNYISSDPALRSAVSNLNAVKTYSTALSSMASTMDIIGVILTVFEILSPIVKIASEVAASWCTGGLSATESANDLAISAEFIVQKVLTATFYILRKFIFDKIRINLPAILVGAINTVSIKEAYTTVNSSGNYLSNNTSFYTAAFSDQFYQETLNSLTWQSSIEAALQEVYNETGISKADKILNWANAGLYGSNDATYSARSEDLLRRFLNSMTRTHMNSAIIIARNKTGVIDYNDDSRAAWNSYINNSPLASTTIASGDETSDLTTTITAKSVNVLLQDESDVELFKGDEESIRLISKKLIEVM